MPAKDKAQKTVSPAEILAAALSKAPVDRKTGYREVVIAGTDGNITVYQAPDGHIGQKWMPPGTNPKSAIRIPHDKAVQFKGQIDKYIGTAKVVQELNKGATVAPPARAGKKDAASVSLF